MGTVVVAASATVQEYTAQRISYEQVPELCANLALHFIDLGVIIVTIVAGAGGVWWRRWGGRR